MNAYNSITPETIQEDMRYMQLLSHSYVDVDAFTLGLLQQQFQIVEIVAGDDDERPLLHRQRDCGRRGRTPCPYTWS